MKIFTVCICVYLFSGFVAAISSTMSASAKRFELARMPLLTSQQVARAPIRIILSSHVQPTERVR